MERMTSILWMWKCIINTCMNGLWNIKSYISIKEGLYKQSQTARRSVVGVRRYSLHLPIGQSRSLLNNGQLGTTPSLLEGTRYGTGRDTAAEATGAERRRRNEEINGSKGTNRDEETARRRERAGMVIRR